MRQSAPLLGEGKYRGKITEWGFGESSKKGTPFFEIMVRLSEWENEDGVWEPLEVPRKRSVQWWLTPNTIERFRSDMRSLGYQEETMAKLYPTHPDAYPLLGKEVQIKVSHEVNDQGRVQEKYLFLRQSGRSAVKMSAEAFREKLAVFDTWYAKAEEKDPLPADKTKKSDKKKQKA